jgi:hypothetical protein
MHARHGGNRDPFTGHQNRDNRRENSDRISMESRTSSPPQGNSVSGES